MSPARDVGESSNPTTDRLLGELIAEVRTVKHNQRNDSQKLDAVNMLVEQVKEMKIEQERHNTRLTLLEADKLRREGAVGLVEWISRHWPFTIILAILAGLVAWANGKLHP
jgi:serine/threonine protein kinase HipA of HipAB toxin-antitoxin module